MVLSALWYLLWRLFAVKLRQMAFLKIIFSPRSWLRLAIEAKRRNHLGQSALHLAAYHGHLSAVDALLKLSPKSLNHPNIQGDTALHLAVYYGHTDLVDLLLAAPLLQVNQVNNAGCSALHLAVMGEHKHLVSKLLSISTIDTSLTNIDGKTAFDLASLHDQHVIQFMLLVNRAASPTITYAATSLSPSCMVKENHTAWLMLYLIRCHSLPSNGL